MLLKKTIQQAKQFFNKRLQSLKSFLFGGCQRLPKFLILNPLSCTTDNPHSHHQLNHNINADFPNRWNSDCQDQAAENVIKKSMMMSRELMIEADEADYNSQAGRFTIISDETAVKKESKGDQENQHEDLATNRSSYDGINMGGVPSWMNEYGGRNWYVLAQKMKELEMIDAGDVDQTLDVEEALHYYSRLRSPIYLDIVDNFFTDMHREFFISQPRISVNDSSSRRLSPLVL